jgi:hypothetical protein
MIDRVLPIIIKLPGGKILYDIMEWIKHSRFYGLFSYRRANYNELTKINALYKEHLLRDASHKLPAILEINQQKHLPNASEQEIDHCFAYDRERNNGELADAMLQIFRMIKHSYDKMKASHADYLAYHYANDPAVLFCAEMACWANEMGKQTIDESMLESIMRRIDYLNDLLANNIFLNQLKDPHDLPATIVKIVTTLEKGIVPQIQMKLTTLSSKAYFSTLAKEAEIFFVNTCRALYILFSHLDVNECQYYNVRAIGGLQHDQSHQKKQTALDKLFTLLVENYHYPHDGLTLEDIKKDTEFTKALEKDLFSKRPTINGMAPDLYSSPTLIHHLIDVVHLLKQLSYLTKSFNGDIGNFLIYKEFHQLTNTIISCFHFLSTQLRNKLTDIYDDAYKIWSTLVCARSQTSWRENFNAYKTDNKFAMESLSKCDIQVYHIMQNMKLTHLHKVSENIGYEMDNLEMTLRTLTTVNKDVDLSITSSPPVRLITSKEIDEKDKISAKALIKSREKNDDRLVSHDVQQEPLASSSDKWLILRRV